ncbi:hypothetical protein SS50377_24928 [Spironucleus salmonicida]|uniref:Uncharacterized protein n=1 Tax=Spironucleus salmonicida TaxID=348837 RepID=V6LRP8_9EUKA|nr:hypothetical protein SS50377_24928 [Spironucleus salmonicida]|eukprot:EST43459.1 Hypothetical protein SS50377_16823 [Spironucleus salmonicida]
MSMITEQAIFIEGQSCLESATITLGDAVFINHEQVTDYNIVEYGQLNYLHVCSKKIIIGEYYTISIHNHLVDIVEQPVNQDQKIIIISCIVLFSLLAIIGIIIVVQFIKYKKLQSKGLKDSNDQGLLDSQNLQ